MAKYYVTSITKISKRDNIPAFYTHSDTHTHMLIGFAEAELWRKLWKLQPVFLPEVTISFNINHFVFFVFIILKVSSTLYLGKHTHSRKQAGTASASFPSYRKVSSYINLVIFLLLFLSGVSMQRANSQL